MHTLLINATTKRGSLKSLYTVPTAVYVLSHIEAFNPNHAVGETINKVYKLPRLACAVLYLHADAWFPTKTTCLKSIRNGNYLT